MGIFNSIFGDKSKEEASSIWIDIDSVEKLQQAIDQSFQQKIAIFKHSTRCGISSRVKSNFEKEILENNPSNIQFYYLDLLSYRALSNKIAEDFGISHQSPQIIVIEKGSAVHHASHSSISLNFL